MAWRWSMYLYRKVGKKGTNNLNITAIINGLVYGFQLKEQELLDLAEDYVRQNHNGTVEIIAISTKE
jgi:hypothetical protein